MQNEVNKAIQKEIAIIREAMKKKEWTAYRLSKESGVTESTLSEMFSGKKNPLLETIVRLKLALGI